MEELACLTGVVQDGLVLDGVHAEVRARNLVVGLELGIKDLVKDVLALHEYLLDGPDLHVLQDWNHDFKV